MNSNQLTQLLLAVLSNLPTEEADAVALIGAFKRLLTGVQSGTITPANFSASVDAILASASAADAAAEATAS